MGVPLVELAKANSPFFGNFFFFSSSSPSFRSFAFSLNDAITHMCRRRQLLDELRLGVKGGRNKEKKRGASFVDESVCVAAICPRLSFFVVVVVAVH